jgi:hypothetical protein
MTAVTGERRPQSEAARAPASRRCAASPQLQGQIGNRALLRMLDQRNSGIAVKGAPMSPDAMDETPSATQPDSTQAQTSEVAPGGGGATPTTSTQPLPFTAMFSIAQHSGRAHAVCGLPDTPNCVVTWAKWRLNDATGAPVMDPTAVDEQFTKISGPDDIFALLVKQKKSVVTEKGNFDDCYGLCVPDGYPPFLLEVQQNYTVDGKIVSQSLLSYSPTGVLLRVCQRGPNGFGPPCRRF